jgi:hypothetical protein
VAKVHGGHVSWVLVGVIELVYWNVWAAFTPLVIALAKRFPLTGPRFISHIAIHTIASFQKVWISKRLAKSITAQVTP